MGSVEVRGYAEFIDEWMDAYKIPIIVELCANGYRKMKNSRQS